MKLILLMGQSNIAGRAKPGPGDRNPPLKNALKFNRDDRWVAPTSPLHFDRDFAGVGPGEEFVRRYTADHPDETVGIVPCGVGGSSLATWYSHGTGNVGANYRNAIRRAKAAAKNGEFIAVLWHQGEADASQCDAKKLEEYYPGEFSSMVGCLRKELGNDKIPVIIGELGTFWGDRAAKLNPILNSLARSVPCCEIVSARGLEHFDKLHFDFRSVTELGRRYYEAYLAHERRVTGESPRLFGDGFHDDTPAIQAMLDSGVPAVYLPPVEKHYLISRSLVVASRQELKLDRFTRIRMAPLSNQPMLVNRSVEKGDVDIAVTGGVWDYANLDQGRNPICFPVNKELPDGSVSTGVFKRDFHLGCIFRFENVKRLFINGLTFRNPTTYSCQLTKVNHFSVQDISFDFDTWNPIRLNMDGIHLDGGCHHGRIVNLRGTAFDDMVALNACDGLCTSFEGPITDIDIDGLYSDYTHRGVRILSTDPSCYVKRVSVRNVHIATYRNIVAITHFFSERHTRGYFDSITIRDVSGTCAAEPSGKPSPDIWPLVWVQAGCDVGQLIIDNVFREEVFRADVPTIGIDEGATVEKLIIRDCRQVNKTKDTLTFFCNKGDVKQVKTDD